MALNLPYAEYQTWSTENLRQLQHVGRRELDNPDVVRELEKILTVLEKRA